MFLVALLFLFFSAQGLAAGVDQGTARTIEVGNASLTHSFKILREKPVASLHIRQEFKVGSIELERRQDVSALSETNWKKEMARRYQAVSRNNSRGIVYFKSASRLQEIYWAGPGEIILVTIEGVELVKNRQHIFVEVTK